jgi:hypothetical protein
MKTLASKVALEIATAGLPPAVLRIYAARRLSTFHGLDAPTEYVRTESILGNVFSRPKIRFGA